MKYEAGKKQVTLSYSHTSTYIILPQDGDDRGWQLMGWEVPGSRGWK
jgi:hypothetical protein